MPPGGHTGPSTAQAGPDRPKPAPTAASNENVQSKPDLSSWWKQFKRSSAKPQEGKPSAPAGIFGVPLGTSIIYAN
ncbi:hypothetical protein LTR28_000707, partial [Elasticomyces elasticus]